MAITAATAPYRVVCADWTQHFVSVELAHNWIFQVESGKPACREIHTIEARDGDQWLPLHIVQARQILAAPVSPTPIDTPDGPLRKYAGSWGPDAEQRAEGIEPGTPWWYLAMGPHITAELSSDGRTVGDGWCRCAQQPDASTWVRYERWDTTGRVAHGFGCPQCRGITQTG